MTTAERKDVGNGIWLCRSCADLIDTDPARFSVEILQRWKQMAEERAHKALTAPRIVNVGADFADTVLLVTRHTSYPAFPESTLKGPRRRRKITLHPLKAGRTLFNVNVPVVGGPPEPPGYGKVVLSCQNQGTGIEQFVRFGLSFAGQSAILRTEINNDRVLLSEGGLEGASFASFMVREILPGESMTATVVGKSDLTFDARLWTQHTGESREVFVYDVIIGDEELVAAPVIHPPSVSKSPKVGRNDPCPCGIGKKFKHCHGRNW